MQITDIKANGLPVEHIKVNGTVYTPKKDIKRIDLLGDIYEFDDSPSGGREETETEIIYRINWGGDYSQYMPINDGTDTLSTSGISRYYFQGDSGGVPDFGLKALYITDYYKYYADARYLNKNLNEIVTNLDKYKYLVNYDMYYGGQTIGMPVFYMGDSDGNNPIQIFYHRLCGVSDEQAVADGFDSILERAMYSETIAYFDDEYGLHINKIRA